MQNAFLSFIHAAFGDDHETLAQLQLIAGRLFLPQCNKTEQVYLHVGHKDDGRSTFLAALGHFFRGFRMEGSGLDKPEGICVLVAPKEATSKQDTASLVHESGSVTAIMGINVPRRRVALLVWDRHDEWPVPSPLTLDEFKAQALTDHWIKHISALLHTQTHVICAGVAIGALDEAAERRVCQIRWHKLIPQEMRRVSFAERIAEDPDFVIWLAEGLRRAQTIDKMQPTIDRPAADIVLSDEPSE